MTTPAPSPTLVQMTYEEVKEYLHDGQFYGKQFLDSMGRHWRVTSVKGWVRRPDLYIGLKHGLRDFGSVTICPGEETHLFKEIKELT